MDDKEIQELKERLDALAADIEEIKAQISNILDLMDWNQFTTDFSFDQVYYDMANIASRF